jgi:DNA-binding NtrC family response regulator
MISRKHGGASLARWPEKATHLPTVLVVEDDVPLREALIAALSAAGYRAKHAGDVMGALKEIEADHVDVVLSDIGMPGNGYNLLAKVRELKPATPVILMTGIEEDDSGRRARDAGAYAYLVKPIRLSTLRRTLEDACRQAE